MGVPESLSKRIDRKVLECFGHLERIGCEILTERVYISEMRGERGRVRSPFRWMVEVRKACAERGIGLEEAKGCIGIGMCGGE